MNRLRDWIVGIYRRIQVLTEYDSDKSFPALVFVTTSFTRTDKLAT